MWTSGNTRQQPLTQDDGENEDKSGKYFDDSDDIRPADTAAKTVASSTFLVNNKIQMQAI